MKIWLLILISTLWSCADKEHKDLSVADLPKYDGTRDDTTSYSYTELDYEKVCKDLNIRSCTPNKEKLSGNPDSYTEWVSEYTNWTKEECEKAFKESKGAFYLDTTDRDFEKFWYNSSGLLARYEKRNFGDMMHNECLISYSHHGDIEEIRINDLVTDSIKYRNRTVKIAHTGRVLDIRHNIVSK